MDKKDKKSGAKNPVRHVGRAMAGVGQRMQWYNVGVA